ncbi:MAG: helix-turn-helix domain-containing protein [Eubacteriales bacterium]|nr:helix-turn-helix domain-containing protein [Eubacteriales bacterium]
MDENFSARRIKEICEQRGISIDALARITGVTKSTLSNLVRSNNSPNVNTIARVCEGLGITVSQFFKEDMSFEGETMDELSDHQKHILEITRKIPDRELKPLLEYLEYLAEIRNKGQKDNEE